MLANSALNLALPKLAIATGATSGELNWVLRDYYLQPVLLVTGMVVKFPEVAVTWHPSLNGHLYMLGLWQLPLRNLLE